MQLPGRLRALLPTTVWAVPLVLIGMLALASELFGKAVAAITLGFILAAALGWVVGVGLHRGEVQTKGRTFSPEAVPAEATPGAGAVLRGADLRGADLTGAELQGVDLRGADLSGAILREANLRGARLAASSGCGPDQE